MPKVDRFRPQRVRILHHEPVTLAFGSKRVTVPLSKLSVTGGVLGGLSDNYIEEAFADITIQTAFGPVRSPIEFLATTVPGQLHAVPFRFFNMEINDRRKLEQTVRKMINQGLAETHDDGWFQTLMRRVRRVT